MKYRYYLALLTSITLLTATAPMTILAESNSNTEATDNSTSTDVSENKENTDKEKDSSNNKPEKPNGEQPPAKPDGEAPNGEGGLGGEKPDGQPPEKPNGEAPDGMGGPGGGANTQTYDYSGELNGSVAADGTEETSADTTVEATEKDQNALLVHNGGSLTATNDTVTKSGDDTDGDNCNFYGLNSIALAVGENSLLTISDSTLSAKSTGSNAVFATDNATAYVSGTTIKTEADNSRGLDATYGGTIVAENVNIETKGDHSASIATDRGGGNISTENSTLNTEGSGSPLLYSTGTIEVDQVTGTASGSQIAGMEGLNTILIQNSNLSSTITDKTASDPVANGVIIYQSTSGDAETSAGEKALFQATNSTLSSAIKSGSMFYVTNTSANVILSDTVLEFDSENANLLQIEGNNANNWGSAGSNGADVTFTAIGETLSGGISVDTISSLDLYLLENTSYSGNTVITENTDSSESKESPITVNIDNTSTWILTEDSTITHLNAAEGAQIVDAEGNSVTILVDGEKVVEGTSSITLTVTGSYTQGIIIGTDNAVTDTTIDRTEFESKFSA